MTTAMKLKKCLLLGRKAMTNLDIILKNRDESLWTKVRLVKAMVVALTTTTTTIFPIAMYGCESWTIKIAEH